MKSKMQWTCCISWSTICYRFVITISPRICYVFVVHLVYGSSEIKWEWFFFHLCGIAMFVPLIHTTEKKNKKNNKQHQRLLCYQYWMAESIKMHKECTNYHFVSTSLHIYIYILLCVSFHYCFVQSGMNVHEFTMHRALGSIQLAK